MHSVITNGGIYPYAQLVRLAGILDINGQIAPAQGGKCRQDVAGTNFQALGFRFLIRLSKQGCIVHQASSHLRMFAPKGLLPNHQAALKGLPGLIVSFLAEVQCRQLGQTFCHIWMVGTQRLFPDFQTSLAIASCLTIVSLGPIQSRQIVQRCSQLRMPGAQEFLLNSQSPEVKRPAFIIFSASGQKLRQWSAPNLPISTSRKARLTSTLLPSQILRQRHKVLRFGSVTRPDIFPIFGDLPFTVKILL
jgi:hypothetical protein